MKRVLLTDQTEFWRSCRSYCQGRIPKSDYQRKHSQRVAFDFRVYWSYPKGIRSKDRPAPELPKGIRIGKGIKPTEEELNRIKEIIAVFKPTLGFVPIAGLVYLFGRDIAAQLTWMAKNGQAGLSVDRWGRPVYLKLKV